jgi:hypothetical protein
MVKPLELYVSVRSACATGRTVGAAVVAVAAVVGVAAAVVAVAAAGGVLVAFVPPVPLVAVAIAVAVGLLTMTVGAPVGWLSNRSTAADCCATLIRSKVLGKIAVSFCKST